MRLSQLLRRLPGFRIEGSENIDIKFVSCDSKSVIPQTLFCCIEGFKTDGHDYIESAVAAGAAAVCVSKKAVVPAGITVVTVDDMRKALALFADEFYGRPSEKMKVVGVTGTNGKTTTTFMIDFLLNSLGVNTGLMGTLYTKIGDRRISSSVTTPDAVFLQKTLAEMLDENMKAVVFEVSSHALSLDRVYSCRFDRAVFTNLTQDHLDFHADFEDYFSAKLKLFESLNNGSNDAVAILNADDPWSGKIVSELKVPFLRYSVKSDADFRALNCDVRPDGITYTLLHNSNEYEISLGVSGFFNIYNSLAAIATISSFGFSIAEIARCFTDFKGVKGRFELVECGQDFSVVVDYAHTPDGLLNVLDTARKMTRGRLISVFGCGGDRDRLKRPLMAEIACRNSDFVVITSDNPRTEDPEKIIDDIKKGLPSSFNDYRCESDRKKAIFTALESARPSDTVVIAGKGHEDYQILRDRTIHFDDSEIVREFFQV